MAEGRKRIEQEVTEVTEGEGFLLWAMGVLFVPGLLISVHQGRSLFREFFLFMSLR